ncbi:MAG: hypothetical protein JOZ18_16980 [Chloroflexi bacterium]|nr:hypothetical protein [Chloroflexota bacterium]
MSDEAHQSQQFEQATATIFTCRSVIKYNSMLSEEQKKELIADIDTTLQFLRTRFVVVVPTEEEKVSSSLPHVEAHPVVPSTDEHGDNRNGQHALQALYKMYHTYLGMQQSNNISTFIARFNDVMSAMNEVQSIVERRSDCYVSVTPLIERVSSFIADLYCVFIEFIRALSNALEANDVHLNTEEVVAMQGYYADCQETGTWQRALSPLRSVYDAYLLLTARKGPLSGRVGDTMAFLEFLEESLAGDFSKREEIISQLDKATVLLRELSQLLADYEAAMSTLLSPGR